MWIVDALKICPTIQNSSYISALHCRIKQIKRSPSLELTGILGLVKTGLFYIKT